MKKKYMLFAGIGILIVAALLIGGFMLFGGDKPMDNKNNRLYIEEKNPQQLSKPNLPEADIQVTVNGKQEQVKRVCNSQVIKCTSNGCEEVC